MALSQPSKAKTFLYRVKSFMTLQSSKCSSIEVVGRAQFSSDSGGCSSSGQVEFAKWRKLDSGRLGIAKSMISVPSWTVLRNLRAAGFEAYLVGGCVRDLLLNKVPKDFDVITTARLKQLRTVIPAHLSFKEDEARILRGLRIAARLNLSFSKETEAAIYSLSPLVAHLDKSRINLEMNYMLSYGAAEPSLLLLKRFKLLEILLPFHVFVPQNMGKRVKHIYNILTENMASFKAEKRNLERDYGLLTAGNVNEVRFMLGKIILRTLICRVTSERGATRAKRDDDIQATDSPRKLEVPEQIRGTLICLNEVGPICNNENKRKKAPVNYDLAPKNASKPRLLERSNIAADYKSSGEQGSERSDISSPSCLAPKQD
ncbi:UNVERIFIED_CONTAM: Poly(A) polymerase I [Sesamum angustifolium]|uniref:Poly(A) polymerase I n=1 Tax=Sesamum angustifolium TaxID=2727405 RepID=A0AAW2RK76_9LAMI